ncbi:hypothetical protein WDZ92_50765, partial [Nostoc sp. NIES-2111]
YKSALRGGHRPKYFDLQAEFHNFRYHSNIYTSGSTNQPNWPFHTESIKVKRGPLWKQVAGRSPRGVTIGTQSLPAKNLRANESVIAGLGLLGPLSKEEQESLDRLKTFAIFAPATGVLRGGDSDPRIKEPLGLTGGGLVSAIREIIKEKSGVLQMQRFFKILSWYRNISVRAATSVLKNPLFGGGETVLAFDDQFMVGDFNTLYSYDVSEGALYVAFMLALMLHPRTPKFFA